LREIFSDQLLVRGRDGMVPTERAPRPAPRAQTLLADLEGLVDATAPFDALSSNHSFTIASPDYLAPVFQAEIVSSVRREAPNVSLVIRARTGFRFRECIGARRRRHSDRQLAVAAQLSASLNSATG
jgi:DNA-binding transcriptional LysR family regulator